MILPTVAIKKRDSGLFSPRMWQITVDGRLFASFSQWTWALKYANEVAPLAHKQHVDNLQKKADEARAEAERRAR